MAKRKERINIVIAGRINAGKSSLLNLLSGQKGYAITDPTPGTTADTVKSVMEIHGLGPVKIFDTAGVDEFSELGNKKRKKTFEAIEEADLVLLVIDSRLHPKSTSCGARGNDTYNYENEIIEFAQKKGKQVLTVFNAFGDKKLEDFSTPLRSARNDKEIDSRWSFNHDGHRGWNDNSLPSLAIDVSDFKNQRLLIEFIKKHFHKRYEEVELLPFLKNTGYVLLIIPMDEETPKLRLLRPQDMAIERLLRKFFIPVLYRMDLKRARMEYGVDFSTSLPLVASLEMTNKIEEKSRFLELVNHLRNSKQGLKLIITDSQAMDILAKWAPKDVPLTTFSIMMTDYMSNGNLDLFVQGVSALQNLKNGDKILIAEACNHDRKAEDIGTVQIPKIFKEKFGLNLHFDYSAGRVFPEGKDLKKYKLIIHCGGCMIDKQKYLARLEKLKEYNIPITNYGVILSYFQGEEALKKVTEPWRG